MLEALLRQGDILSGPALPMLPYASPARLFLDTLLERCSGKLDPGQVPCCTLWLPLRSMFCRGLTVVLGH